MPRLPPAVISGSVRCRPGCDAVRRFSSALSRAVAPPGDARASGTADAWSGAVVVADLAYAFGGSLAAAATVADWWRRYTVAWFVTGHFRAIFRGARAAVGDFRCVGRRDRCVPGDARALGGAARRADHFRGGRRLARDRLPGGQPAAVRAVFAVVRGPEGAAVGRRCPRLHAITSAVAGLAIGGEGVRAHYFEIVDAVLALARPWGAAFRPTRS